jgi:hypothetical protein
MLADSKPRGVIQTFMIEDAGSGTSLIQELRDHGIPAIPIRPVARIVSASSGTIAAAPSSGCIYFATGAQNFRPALSCILRQSARRE